MSVPLGERGGTLRGAIDLACARLPGFVFGGRIGSLVPVFHFHDERTDSLEPKFRHLRENGYQTLGADELSAVVRRQRPIREREVALCFDDAWASVWTDAAPLLRQYGLRAIVYPIPGRVADALTVRADDQPGGSPFMTWPELRALHAEGLIDVQSHTWMHARVFTSATVVDFVKPGYEHRPALNRPRLNGSESIPRFVEPVELGAPLYEQRSRMSDGRRYYVPLEAHAACVTMVSSEGGAAFFSRPGWRAKLTQIVERHAADGRIETEEDQRRAVEVELDRARAELNARLATTSIRHVCLPWGVSGAVTTAALQRLGFETAIANRWRGRFAVSPGDDPFWLKRLPNRYVFALPGEGRRTFFSLSRAR
jgi:Polysaccharide deacetylase